MRHVSEHLFRTRARAGLRARLPHQRRAQRRIARLHRHLPYDHADTHRKYHLHRPFRPRDVVRPLWNGGHARRYESREQRCVVVARRDIWRACIARCCAGRGRGRMVMRDGFAMHVYRYYRWRVHQARSVPALYSGTHQHPLDICVTGKSLTRYCCKKLTLFDVA